MAPMDAGWAATRRAILGAAVIAAACSSSPDAPSAPTGPAAAGTMTISTAGLAPKAVEIPLGGRVLFINNDTRAHFIGSDPHPDHTDCPSINQVGLLVPGQRRETLNFVTAEACGFHDHNEPDNQAIWGTIRIK
jgi:hypothetical protein